MRASPTRQILAVAALAVFLLLAPNAARAQLQGGAGSLSTLSDVAVTGVHAPTDGLVLTYNAALTKWIPAVGGGSSSITLNAGAGVGLSAPGAMSLGSTYTIGAVTDNLAFGSLTLNSTGTGSYLNSTAVLLPLIAANASPYLWAGFNTTSGTTADHGIGCFVPNAGGFQCDIQAGAAITSWKYPAPSGTTVITGPPSDGTNKTLSTLAGTETLTNKTIVCANNTCTVRIGSDVSGLGTSVATFLGTPTATNLGTALGTQTANTVLSGPSSGSAANPTFRALAAADLPGVPDSTKSANYPFAAGDMGGTVNLTGTGWTLTAPAISATIFANGMFACYQNQGTGTITLSSTPTINFPGGVTGTSLSILPGLGGCLLSNGSTLDWQPGSVVSSTTVYGVGLSLAAVSHNFLDSIVAGVPHASQPAFTDLSGAASVAQLGTGAASHAIPVDVAGASTYKVVPDCTDTGGSHLNYTQSSDAFSCGSSGGGGTSQALTRQRFTTGSAATYTTPANANKLIVTQCGAGAGSGGLGAGAGTGGTGGTTTFNSVTAIGGTGGTGTTSTTGGTGGVGGQGGTGALGTGGFRITGGDAGDGGNVVGAIAQVAGGVGGDSFLGAFQAATASNNGAGANGVNSASVLTGGSGGGGGGECLQQIIVTPGATYTYTVGAAGTAGAGATAGLAGNAGVIVVDEYYGITTGTYTNHGILLGTGSGINATAAGTAGQVLTSNGAAADPTYQTASGGGATTFISTQTASNTATDLIFDSSTSGALTGTDYELRCRNLITATSAVTLYLQFGTGGTPTYQTANYAWNGPGMQNGGTAVDLGSNSDSGIPLARVGQMATTRGTSGRWDLFNLVGAVYHDVVGISDGFTQGSIYQMLAIGGTYTGDTNAVTGLRVHSSSGNINTGSCSLYSVKTS